MEYKLFRARIFDTFRDELLELFSEKFNQFIESYAEICIADRKFAESYLGSFEKIVSEQVENHIYYKLVATDPKLRRKLSRIKGATENVNLYSASVMKHVNETPKLKKEFSQKLKEIVNNCFLIPNLITEHLTYDSKRLKLKELGVKYESLIKKLETSESHKRYLEVWEMVNSDQITNYKACQVIAKRYDLKEEDFRRSFNSFEKQYREVIPMIYTIVIRDGILSIEKNI